VKHCMNCGDLVEGRPWSASRGPDIAWFIHCRPCGELVTDQMEISHDRPSGHPIQIHRCKNCGVARTCRPGWRTRCHICLDERTYGVAAMAAGDELLAGSTLPDSVFLAIAQRSLGDPKHADTVTIAAAAKANLLALRNRLALHERSGWTLLAGDVHGLPWTAQRERTMSHGVWGTHDNCGNVQKIPLGRVECEVCGPEPDSMTYWARRDEPYLLYLVRYGNIQKFGCGDARRVQAHLNSGAQLLQVRESSHERVVAAELELKRRYRRRSLPSAATTMPHTFGTGTEVVSARIKIDLRDVLSHSRDMSESFE